MPAQDAAPDDQTATIPRPPAERPRAAPRMEDDFLPPEDIPDAGAPPPPPPSRGRRQAGREKNIFEELFDGQ
jgi:hypothetical protein